MLKHFKFVDSIEFKLSVPDSDRASVVRALEMDVLKAELRQAVFFDTADLKLSRGGVVLRARRTPKGGDAIVKLRPVVPEDLPLKLRRSNSFKVEVDAMPGSIICSGTLKAKADNDEVNEVLQGKLPIRKLFLPEQRAFYKQHAPTGVDMDSLIPLGPINIAKLKFQPRGLRDRAMVAELWFYPDGSRILELSTKCLRTETFQVLAETRAFLTLRGVPLDGAQETKTRKALDYFSHLHNGNGKRNIRTSKKK
jgi:hypothetical protein